MLVYLANLCCQKVLCALCPGVVGWKCFSHGPLTTAAVLDCRSRLKQKCFSLTGHCLGGAVAVDVNRRTGLKTTAFNPLSSINGIGSGMAEKDYCKTVGRNSTRCKNAQNSTVIKSLGDPVASRYQGADRIKTVAPKKANIHSLDNF
jgi:hypothetical protein